MENPIKMDDLGVLLFLETPIKGVLMGLIIKGTISRETIPFLGELPAFR